MSFIRKNAARKLEQVIRKEHAKVTQELEKAQNSSPRNKQDLVNNLGHKLECLTMLIELIEIKRDKKKDIESYDRLIKDCFEEIYNAQLAGSYRDKELAIRGTIQEAAEQAQDELINAGKGSLPPFVKDLMMVIKSHHHRTGDTLAIDDQKKMQLEQAYSKHHPLFPLNKDTHGFDSSDDGLEYDMSSEDSSDEPSSTNDSERDTVIRKNKK